MGVGGRCRAGAAAVLLLVAAGCSAFDAESLPLLSESETEPVEDDSDLDQSHEFMADVTVQVSGVHAFHWRGRNPISVTRVGSPDVAVNMLAAGFWGAVEVPGQPNARFRWAFDLLEGYADRPGVFTIPATVRDGPSVQSDALFIFHYLKDDWQPPDGWEDVERTEEYRVVLEPCQLEVGPHEKSGSLRCPSIEGPEGRTVALEVAWTGVAAS